MFIKDVLANLFSGVNAVTVAGWIRGFFAAIWGALAGASIDIGGQLTATGKVDWVQAGHTALKVCIPVAIAYLLKGHSGNYKQNENSGNN